MPAPPPAKPPHSELLSFVLLALVMALVVSLFFIFIGLAALVVLHVFIAGRALRRRVVREGGGPDNQLGPPVLPFFASSSLGLSSKDLQQLPAVNYDAATDAADCPVCLEGIRDGERCRVLPVCGHVFHVRCVDRWLIKTPACPVCRTVVRPGLNGVEDDGGGVGLPV